MSDERYLRLRDVQDAIDSITWSAEDHDGAVGFRAAISQKIAGLDWLAGRAVQDDGLPPESPERRFLLGLVDTLYGGADRSPDLPDRLDTIAGILDRVDEATEAYCVERGATHLVSRSFQADLREAADRLRAAPPLHDPTGDES